MTAQELLLDGFNLMLIGIGLVFVFLALLIVFIRFMSALMSRLAPAEAALAPAVVPVRNKAPAAGLPDADTLQAIAEAVRQHRARF